MRAGYLRRSISSAWWKSFSGNSRGYSANREADWCYTFATIQSIALFPKCFYPLQSSISRPYNSFEHYCWANQAISWRCGVSANEEPLCKSRTPLWLYGYYSSSDSQKWNDETAAFLTVAGSSYWRHNRWGRRNRPRFVGATEGPWHRPSEIPAWPAGHLGREGAHDFAICGSRDARFGVFVMLLGCPVEQRWLWPYAERKKERGTQNLYWFLGRRLAKPRKICKHW
jgi:hypothetical protein